MTYTVHPTTWQTHQADLVKIRTDVFMHEQQVSAADEWDGLDENAQHFLVRSSAGEAVGCARLLFKEQDGETLCHIGRVAILKPFRGQGLGHKLVAFIISHCKNIAPECSIYLHAQTDRRRFYEALGFIAQGEEFMDAGIPHISMHLASFGDVATNMHTTRNHGQC